MLTIDEAFRKFKGRLELNDKEQSNASARQTEVREYLDSKFKIDRSFLTGSYARWTKTKPLKDVDILFVLSSSEKSYREKSPSVVLQDFHKQLESKYGRSASIQNRSIGIDFGVEKDEDDNTNYQVMSVDVVPAFAVGNNYEIPDKNADVWIKTNPEVHADKAVKAHQAYASEWKGLVRMLKYWNNNSKHGEKPIKPSFLIEVMALQCLYGGWGGSFDREFQSLFATMADRIAEDWLDPAGLGPPISNAMTPAMRGRAKDLLLAASRDASSAIDHVRKGRNGDALKAWRGVFGPKFPLS
jgi:predicted nucleotidyltransferase